MGEPSRAGNPQDGLVRRFLFDDVRSSEQPVGEDASCYGGGIRTCGTAMLQSCRIHSLLPVLASVAVSVAVAAEKKPELRTAIATGPQAQDWQSRFPPFTGRVGQRAKGMLLRM